MCKFGIDYFCGSIRCILFRAVDRRYDNHRVIMHRYWFDLLLLAYGVTCTDVMVTAWGIAKGIGREGNPVVVAVVPHSEPIMQILFMAATTIACFWFILYTWTLIREGESAKYTNNYTYAVSWGSLFACGTHIFGIATWII